MKRWTFLIGGILLGFIMGGVIYLVASPKYQPSMSFISPTASTKITVSITGSVKIPGVYTLNYGSRVNDVINTAGGILDDANIDGISLAQIVTDEENIYIPSKGISETASDSISQGKINLNTATLEELISLPGIGNEKAQAVIDFRNQHGNFSSIEDLLYVPGFGQGIFDSIKDLIVVN
jgi:competence protein ComEA